MSGEREGHREKEAQEGIQPSMDGAMLLECVKSRERLLLFDICCCRRARGNDAKSEGFLLPPKYTCEKERVMLIASPLWLLESPDLWAYLF